LDNRLLRLRSVLPEDPSAGAWRETRGWNIHLNTGDKRLIKVYGLISVVGIVQFLFLTFVAACFYPGGYDYFGYYFSDLGAVTARNGEPNTLSSTLFSISLPGVALSLIPFWIGVRALSGESKLGRVLSKIGSVSGLFSTPFDVHSKWRAPEQPRLYWSVTLLSFNPNILGSLGVVCGVSTEGLGLWVLHLGLAASAFTL